MTNKVTCIVVDDEPLAIELLEEYINQTPRLQLLNKFDNPLSAMEYLKSHKVDILFVDIQMPVLTGIDLVKILQEPPTVIFTTAYREYAVESYDLEAIDYLVKPITYVRFIKAINKYNESLASHTTQESPSQLNTPIEKPKESIYVNVNKKYIKIVFSDIHYIESVKDYIDIHMKDNVVTTKSTITDFYTKLPDNFIRIHRSFIVNRKQVTAFTQHDLEIGDKELPIGKSYKQDVMRTLN